MWQPRGGIAPQRLPPVAPGGGHRRVVTRALLVLKDNCVLWLPAVKAAVTSLSPPVFCVPRITTGREALWNLGCLMSLALPCMALRSCSHVCTDMGLLLAKNGPLF